MLQRFDYDASAYLTLATTADGIAIARAYGVVSISMLVMMRADIIEDTEGRCVISDLSSCVITSAAAEIDDIYEMAASGCSRDRSCAWVVPVEGGAAWRHLAAKMANLGHPRRVFTGLSAALEWAREEAALTQW